MSSISHVSSIAELPAPIAVCCHDAGAANLIAAWVAESRVQDIRICAEGPAAQIFAQATPDRERTPLAAALRDAGCLLSGTGWTTDLEHRARVEAKEREIPSIAVLDHWVNYRARFERGAGNSLPDLLVVTDREALALAQREFGSECPAVLWSNRYLETEVRRVHDCSPGAALPADRLLVVLEPIRQDWETGTVQAAEFRALDFLHANLHAIFASPERIEVRLRPHPSESAAKYAEWLERRHLPSWQLSVEASLAKDIAWTGVAAGLNSYALIVALEAGRRAVSYLPPGAPPCPLKHGRLEYLTQLPGAKRLPGARS